MADGKPDQTTPERIPVTLLAGFLGSGKTTLANRILSEQHGQRIAVIVNEFGDVGIDGHLVVGVEDNVVQLSNGCICCTVRNDLQETLLSLLKQRHQLARAEPFERVLIEASGLASPGPAVQTILMDPVLSSQLQLDGVITMTHAQHIMQQLLDHPEASDQVGYADHIILNHCDQSDTEGIEAAEASIRACNGNAELVRTTRASVDVLSLLNTNTWELRRAQRAQQAVHVHDDTCEETHDSHDDMPHHTSGVGTLSLRMKDPLDLNRLKMWLLFLAKRQSHELMRLKGILHCQHHEKPILVQGVYQWLELQTAPDDVPEESVLVLIGRHLDEAELRREWDDCRART